MSTLPRIQRFECPGLNVAELVQALFLIIVIESGEAWVGVDGAVIEPLVMGTTHAHGETPLGLHGDKQLKGRPVFGPDVAVLGLYILRRVVIQPPGSGVIGAAVLDTAARPVPTGLFQFFAAASPRPCWAWNQLSTSGRRT